MYKGKRKEAKQQDHEQQSNVFSTRCYYFLRPFLVELNQLLDRRLVNTCLQLVLVILIHRHRNQGLLLSELGELLLSPERAPSGTKRIANLIHSPKWQVKHIQDYLWQQADERLDELMRPDQEVYVIWDESVIEKPESLKLDGLCAVRSSKARRLKRIKPGFYNPPGGRPIFVPGVNWLQILLIGLKSTPSLAHFRFWSTRGEGASDKRAEEGQVLAQLAQRWGKWVIHVWDRGFAGSPWVSNALEQNVFFILRWKKDYKLQGPKGEQKAWQITIGKRSWEHRLIYDCKRRCQRKTGVVVAPVFLPSNTQNQLWLVVSRPGAGRTPWYLLTNLPVDTPEDAWRIVFGYNRRWQVEMSLRFDKSELAFECPRLIKRENREKLLGLAALAYAFLLSLVHPGSQTSQDYLLRFWCHRTGKRSLLIQAPLYRLRLALSRLWLAFRPLCLPRLI
jgi:hypothetical protein